MTSVRYMVHVVHAEEYAVVRLEQDFREGRVVGGLAGLGDDCLVVTAHPMAMDGVLPPVNLLQLNTTQRVIETQTSGNTIDDGE